MTRRGRRNEKWAAPPGSGTQRKSAYLLRHTIDSNSPPLTDLECDIKLVWVVDCDDPLVCGLVLQVEVDLHGEHEHGNLPVKNSATATTEKVSWVVHCSCG